jgi:YD repeat-containing protein
MLAYYPRNLLTTTDPLNRTTTLTYDNAGNVATSTDALSRVTNFEYDTKNRLKHVVDPLLGETLYDYDGRCMTCHLCGRKENEAVDRVSSVRTLSESS